MQKYQFTSIDEILSRFFRNFKESDEVDEVDLIEYIGDAMSYVNLPNIIEEAIRFVEVDNYECELPNNFRYVKQIARNNLYDEDPRECHKKRVKEKIEEDENIESTYPGCDNLWLRDAVPVDSQGNILTDYDVAYFRPSFDVIGLSYQDWSGSGYFKNEYSPVVLADNSFFNSIVCRPDEAEKLMYADCQDEYTVVQDKLRFSFKKGFVAIAYYRTPTDEKGLPMVINEVSLKEGIYYYLVAKIKEREAFSHRQGSFELAQYADNMWKSKFRQFMAKAKLPRGVDEHEAQKRIGNTMILNRNMTDSFFGSLNKKEVRNYHKRGKRHY